MRAIAISKFGGPEVLTVVDRPMPEPARGEVRVRVHATAINRADVLQRMGAYPAPADRDRPEFISGKLVDENGNEQEIDPNKLYTIVTLDYLLRLNSGAYAVLQEAKKSTPLNITLRDAVMNYVKSETAAGRTVGEGRAGR